MVAAADVELRGKQACELALLLEIPLTQLPLLGSQGPSSLAFLWLFFRVERPPQQPSPTLQCACPQADLKAVMDRLHDLEHRLEQSEASKVGPLALCTDSDSYI